jgi:hypothetical protein
MNPQSNERGSNEEMVLSEVGQVGTQFDGFAHQSHRNSHYNCFKTDEITTRTGFTKLGVLGIPSSPTIAVLMGAFIINGLQVISSSPGELEPVFQAMLENAVRFCEAKFGTLFVCEGDAFRRVALHGAPPAFVEEQRREPVVRPSRGHNLERVARTKQVTRGQKLFASLRCGYRRR